MDILSNFGENLSVLLFDSKTDVKELAQKTNIDRSVIYKYLRKKVLPNLNNLIVICDCFNCSADFILGLSPEKANGKFSPVPPFCERFKAVLQIKGYTRYRLIKELRLKNIRFSKQSVDDWYHGSRLPSVDKVVILAKFFSCTLDYLLGRES